MLEPNHPVRLSSRVMVVSDVGKGREKRSGAYDGDERSFPFDEVSNEPREKGTPPGGVISPWLANRFLHYGFDVWVEKHCQGIQLVRYADDIICHGRTEPEVRQLHQQLTQRFTEGGLTWHPEKTKIVYCQSWKHTADYERISFDFLGFTFRPRQINSRDGHRLVGFVPAISRTAAKRIRTEMNSWTWRSWIPSEIHDILRFSRDKICGWVEYYGKFGMHSIKWVLLHFDKKLSRWAKRKYKSLKTYRQAARRVMAFQKRNAKLLAHW
ncbi:MAG: hypothetical protein HC877_08140 [Thioploca sp.]|nr:hypothetical protein [Thioploca sp.]